MCLRYVVCGEMGVLCEYISFGGWGWYVDFPVYIFSTDGFMLNFFWWFD
jgi:hypothetical protein